uniref:Uncharacterized protein n=1 Tax=Romanomermis culicivorax TaxID=13658 RepID=A0A915KI13_ROMCU
MITADVTIQIAPLKSMNIIGRLSRALKTDLSRLPWRRPINNAIVVKFGFITEISVRLSAKEDGRGHRQRRDNEKRSLASTSTSGHTLVSLLTL